MSSNNDKEWILRELTKIKVKLDIIEREVRTLRESIESLEKDTTRLDTIVKNIVKINSMRTSIFYQTISTIIAIIISSLVVYYVTH